MPNVTITTDDEFCIIETQTFEKTISDVKNLIFVNRTYESGSWTGDLTTTQVNAIRASSDAWDRDFVAQEDGAEDVPTGFKPALYEGLEATLTNKVNDTVMADDNVTDTLLDQLRDVYSQTGVAGLENAGWASTSDDTFELVANCSVTVTPNP
jgi:hypothetical protein